jgi:glucose 1-dehydrogenase
MMLPTTRVCTVVGIFLLVAVHCIEAYSLKGKTALVTGSSGGIGKGIAVELANQGCQVIVHYNEREQGAVETQKILGDKCLGVLMCDFRSRNSQDPKSDDCIEKFMNDAMECCGERPLDILVNNAGVVSKLAIEDDSNQMEIWHQTMDVNLHAPCQLSKLFLAHHQASERSEGGVIINVSSIHGENSNEYMAAYAASKAALDALTKTTAMEFAPYNIRVNAIAPGVVPVERTAKVFDDPAVMKGWTDNIPVNRVGTVEDVAKATVPLITNEWITGTIWKVDGGMMARGHYPNRPRPPSPFK